MQKTSLYLIESPELGVVKIGISSNPKARCASLQTGSAFPLRVAYTKEIPERFARFAERSAHEWLKADRMLGEWFRADTFFGTWAIDSGVARASGTKRRRA